MEEDPFDSLTNLAIAFYNLKNPSKLDEKKAITILTTCIKEMPDLPFMEMTYLCLRLHGVKIGTNNDIVDKSIKNIEIADDLLLDARKTAVNAFKSEEFVDISEQLKNWYSTNKNCRELIDIVISAVQNRDFAKMLDYVELVRQMNILHSMQEIHDSYSTEIPKLLVYRDFSQSRSQVMPNSEAILEIMKFCVGKKLLEIEAYKGYWSFLLKLAGVDVVATATEPKHPRVEQLSPVEAIDKYKPDVLMVIFPTSSIIDQIFSEFKGSKFIYIGYSEDLIESFESLEFSEDFGEKLEEIPEKLEEIPEKLEEILEKLEEIPEKLEEIPKDFEYLTDSDEEDSYFSPNWRTKKTVDLLTFGYSNGLSCFERK
jgi:predicted transcriptional regulator